MDSGLESAERRSPLARLGIGTRQLGRRLVDVALPPQCLACDRWVTDQGALCPHCWSRLRLIERPYCERLGIPFTYDLGPRALSAEAIADPPPFDRCRAVAAFDEVARRMVHGLKYRDRMELSAWMGGWMVRAGTDVVESADLIVPVPLHRWRLWWRRFNQSVSLAGTVSKLTRKPLATQILLRVKSTPQQVGLTADERDRNVRGAFHIAPAGKPAIAGRRVLLVDDVYTTGATAKAATRALLRAGAAAVDVLVFSRVVRGAE